MNQNPHKVRVRQVLDGLAQGRPLAGPMQVHLDITNGCNAACVTCWDPVSYTHLTLPTNREV